MTTHADSTAARDADATPQATTSGRVESIHVAATKGAPVEAVARVRALEGVGLEGDRYTRMAQAGLEVEPDRHLTLIEAEEIERLAVDHGITLAPGETRRNVTTRGVRLNALVGRPFRIGAVECEGVELCEPCADLVAMIGKPVLRPLVHRAGLTARIVSGGDIAIGDEITTLD